MGSGNISTDPSEVMDFFTGACLSNGGRTVFALPSRNTKGRPKILTTIEDWPNQFNLRESVDLVVTEYGVAISPGAPCAKEPRP